LRRRRESRLLNSWFLIKVYGEESLSSLNLGDEIGGMRVSKEMLDGVSDDILEGLIGRKILDLLKGRSSNEKSEARS
jgi:hypothetical protein